MVTEYTCRDNGVPYPNSRDIEISAEGYSV